MKTVSIVIPVYNNSQSLPELAERFAAVAEKEKEYTFEFIYVDDRSVDNSFQVLYGLREKFDNIKIIRLAKNSGSHNAIYAGFNYASGDYIGDLAADLQDPPEIFHKMLRKMEEGHKLAIGVREDREDKSLSSNIFYRIMRKSVYKDFPKNGLDIVLAHKRLVKEVCQMQEKHSPPLTMLIWTGIPYASVFYTRKKRPYGKSQHTFGKKLKYFIDSIITFSYLPIRVFSALGILIAILSFIYGIFIIINYFIGNIPVSGWATIITLIAFFQGVTMLMLGIIGEYLWRTLDEVRGRKAYIIDETYD